MLPLKDDPVYQQSSGDASEEDAGDNDSITSLYDSGTEPPLTRQRKARSPLRLNFDEGENSATTSETSREGGVRRGPYDDQIKATDLVNKRYVDVNSAAGQRMNPPPTDRPVRIYSDGIFDLFHLGYVYSSLVITGDTCDNWSRRRRRFRMYI